MTFKGRHPRSLEASNDPAVIRAIKAGRAKQAADTRAMEAWARQGFVAGSEWTDGGLMLEERQARDEED